MEKCINCGFILYTGKDKIFDTPVGCSAGNGDGHQWWKYCDNCGEIIWPVFAYTPHNCYLPEEPCDHPGCLSHVTHPCEGCGRVAGVYPGKWPET